MMIRRYGIVFRSNNTWDLGLFRTLRLWLALLYQPNSRIGLSRTGFSGFVALFSLFLQLADVLCLDGLSTFDLFRRTQYSTR